jgi:PEP-CTERM motif
MKTEIRTLTTTAALFLFAAVAQAQFTPGDLAVLRVGDGSTTLGNSAGPISLLDLTTAGLVQSTVSIPSGSGGLQISGSATSEGQLVLNADSQLFTVAGYVPPYTGSGSLSGRTSVQAPRGYATVNFAGTVSAVTTLTGTYSANNIRSGFVSGSDAWFAGANGAGSGVEYYNGTSSLRIENVNTRVLGVYGGILYYSTGSGTQGIYKYSGLPTSATTGTAVLTGVAGQGTSPYDFALSPDGNTLYVADNALGVQKFTYNGTSWNFDYNFTDSVSTADKAYGLAVDFSGTNPILYWTSPTDIWKATDLGAGAAGTSILSAGANYAFRGLEVVPEPSSPALAGLALTGLFSLRRFKNRRAC